MPKRGSKGRGYHGIGNAGVREFSHEAYHLSDIGGQDQWHGRLGAAAEPIFPGCTIILRIPEFDSIDFKSECCRAEPPRSAK